MSFIYSTITPRNDELDTKGQITNILVAQKLRLHENAFVCHNNNLYNRGHFEPGNFAADGRHVNEKGTSILAQNAKYAICKMLNIEIIRKPSYQHRRHNNNHYQQHNHFRGGYHGH